MKFCIRIALLLATVCSFGQEQSPLPPRWTKAQKYVGTGFQVVDCFAGQVQIRGRKLRKQPFALFVPKPDNYCCGTVLKRGQTDAHGHFLVEPLEEGKYFARFQQNGVEYTAKVAVIDSYQRCDGTHVEIDFLDRTKAKLQSYVDIDDSGEPCRETEPRCYRR